MKKNEEPTVKKSIRIPTKLAETIQMEAEKDFDNNFSDATNYRMQHYKCPLTPKIVAKVQDIVNLATESIEQNSAEKAEKAQKEVKYLWKYLR